MDNEKKQQLLDDLTTIVVRVVGHEELDEIASGALAEINGDKEAAERVRSQMVEHGFLARRP